MGGDKVSIMHVAKASSAFARFRLKLREVGVLGVLKLVPKNFSYAKYVYLESRFDRRHRVNTAGQTALDKLEIDSENKKHGIRYQPSSYGRLVSMFSNLPKDLGGFTFVDFGSGRGRVLLFASQFNFKQILGVEFSEELHLAAVHNVATFPETRRCADIVPINQDATLFPIPDGPLVLYFFDPFRDQVMQKVLDNIALSYRTRPRKIYLMYLAPVHETLVLATGVFTRVETPPLARDFYEYKFGLFETAPET